MGGKKGQKKKEKGKKERRKAKEMKKHKGKIAENINFHLSWFPNSVLMQLCQHTLRSDSRAEISDWSVRREEECVAERCKLDPVSGSGIYNKEQCFSWDCINRPRANNWHLPGSVAAGWSLWKCCCYLNRGTQRRRWALKCFWRSTPPWFWCT